MTTVTSNMADAARHVFAITLRGWNGRRIIRNARDAHSTTSHASMVTHSRDHDVDASDDAHRPPNRPSYTCSDKKGDENPRIRSCVRKKKQDFDIWSFFSWKLSATENILWYYGLTIYNFSIILLFYYFFILWK